MQQCLDRWYANKYETAAAKKSKASVPLSLASLLRVPLGMERARLLIASVCGTY